MTGGSWRLLRHGAACGGKNMAIDEAVGRAVAEGLAPTTLRFYAWAPPCVSLGRNQAAAAVDRTRCAERGYDVVRRPTGGRAILHTDELTYSVAARSDDPLMAGMILDAYLRLSLGLVAGLRNLGIDAEPAPASNRPGRDVSAACFEVPSAHEIVVDGRKLLGSAQYRRAGHVLQHGSLPLCGDLTRLVECLALPTEAERESLRGSLARHATTVEQAMGRGVGFDEAADALAEGFASALGLNLAGDELTDCERRWAEELAREKYGSEAWTARS